MAPLLSRSIILAGIFFICAFEACSPIYVAQAGWEEAKILLKREKIDHLLKDVGTPDELKRKLELVTEVREFSKTLGLKPKKSFTTYSDIGRDVLVWVVAASEQDSFNAYTWWFPIVGNVPYKGFFSKDDALELQDKLTKKRFDVFVGPSPAFSTLGWFNDPLLSTYTNFDDISLVDTVIHEIVHNTLWVKNNVTFNESFANFVGSVGAFQFFKTIKNDQEKAELAWKSIEDKLRFATLLDSLAERLEQFYAEARADRVAKMSVEDHQKFLIEREKIILELLNLRAATNGDFEVARYKNLASKLNNATINANRIYLTKLDVFMKLFQASNQDLPATVKTVKEVIEQSSKNSSIEDASSNIFDLIIEHIEITNAATN
jgi:predicted aminopeptidase